VEEQARRRPKFVTETRVLWFLSVVVSLAIAVGLGSLLASLFEAILEMPLLSFGVFCLATGVFLFFGYIYLPRAAEIAPGSWVALSRDRRLSKREIELERARIELQREQAQAMQEEAAAKREREEAKRKQEAAERERARNEGRFSAARQQVRNRRKALLNTIATLEERAGMLRDWSTSGRDLFERFGHDRGPWSQDRDVLVQDGAYNAAVRKTDSAFSAIMRVPEHGDVPVSLLGQAQTAIVYAVTELQARLDEHPPG
jgi:hypothetical protein